MRSRKQLPLVGRVKISFSLPELLGELEGQGFLDPDIYRDFDFKPGTPIRDLLERNLEVRTLAMSPDEIEMSKETGLYISDGYRQLYLTEPFDRGAVDFKGPQVGSTAKGRIRRLRRNTKDYDPRADESNYGRVKDNVGPRVRGLLRNFKGILCRIRLAALMPGHKIQPHRDYDPSYLVRYHIPLVTNSKSFVYFQVGEKKYKFSFKADGAVYFLNTGLIHWVENMGETPRIHLLIDIQGQNELADLEEVTAEG